MAIPKIVSDLETSLAAKIAVGGTTGTIVSNVDDDGVTLADGTYYFTIDGNNSAKEHIKCTKTGTALSDIYSVSRQGVETSGVVREHRVGAKVIMTDYATYKNYFTESVANFVSKTGDETIAGVKTFSSSPIVPTPTTDMQASTKKYVDDNAVAVTGDETIAGVKTFSSSPIVPTPTTDMQAATKKYIDDIAIAGGVDASTSAKGITKLSKAPASATEPIAVGSNDFASETGAGIVEEATQAEVAAGTATGGTGAKLFVTPAKLAAYSKPWTLLNSWTYSGDVSEVVLNNLGGYSDLLIVTPGVVAAGTNSEKQITVSEDNGSTFLGANKYSNIPAGAINDYSIRIGDGYSSGSGAIIIHNATGSVMKMVSGGLNGGALIDSSAAINAVRLFVNNGTNLLGGAMYVYGK